MNKRRLGKSDLFVSEMGLGCMSLGHDENKAKEIIHAALDHGVNYLDTADLYDFGINEEFVGKAVKSVRKDVIIATKVGNKWHEDHSGWSWDASKQYIKQAVKDSLSRLQTDYIDLYQLHGGTMEDNHDEVIDTFKELIKEGVIRYYGISSIRPNVISSFASKTDLTSVMMQYSLLDRRPEEWMPLLKEHEISIIARGPIAKGILSDRALTQKAQSVLQKGYLTYTYEQLTELLSSLKEAFASRPIEELAFQYVLSHEEVGAVIPGASSCEQVLKNIKAVQSQKLSAEELQLLRSLTTANKYEQHRI
ncbi:aldo/keto reductase [Bacillus sp. AGMB 02131]|uniref:Aldo/keto reductase n=1 Tax=Peribacillus faecalis TaxID=2772559 RepID=A0A927D208_9BACI|nr:aldo/keto reductase [Peribacillus faecalis]MBD3109589.1 aldo/keto reductase [Peribacillus faecalis]